MHKVQSLGTYLYICIYIYTSIMYPGEETATRKSRDANRGSFFALLSLFSSFFLRNIYAGEGPRAVSLKKSRCVSLLVHMSMARVCR